MKTSVLHSPVSIICVFGNFVTVRKINCIINDELGIHLHILCSRAFNPLPANHDKNVMSSGSKLFDTQTTFSSKLSNIEAL